MTGFKGTNELLSTYSFFNSSSDDEPYRLMIYRIESRRTQLKTQKTIIFNVNDMF